MVLQNQNNVQVDNVVEPGNDSIGKKKSYLQRWNLDKLHFTINEFDGGTKSMDPTSMVRENSRIEEKKGAR